MNGSPLPVVIVPGLLDRGSSFNRLVRQMRRWHPATIRVFERAGYGTRVDEQPWRTVNENVQDLLKFLHEPTIVIGHSFGGLIGIAAAAQSDDVHTVIAFEPPTPWLSSTWPETGETGFPRDDEQVGGSVAALRMAERILGPERWELMSDVSIDQWRSEGAAVLGDLRAMRTYTPPDTVQARRWGENAVLIMGTDSEPYRQNSTRLLANQHNIPITQIDGVDHAPHLWNSDLLSTGLQAVIREENFMTTRGPQCTR